MCLKFNLNILFLDTYHLCNVVPYKTFVVVVKLDMVLCIVDACLAFKAYPK